MSFTSRLSGFYRKDIPERVATLRREAGADDETCAFLLGGGGLSLSVADKMVENVVAIHGLPLGVALNFLVNDREVLIPMAVEEPSVVAAASNAARMVRASGGFHGEATPSLMTAQVQFDEVRECDVAAAQVLAHKSQLLRLGDESIPRMVERGFGCRDLEVRIIDRALGLFVVHVYVDVGDAMGANTVDTVAEALAEPIHELVGGTVGLRILSNLTTHRTVRAGCFVSDEALGGPEISDGIMRASRFADHDPHRAVTHNKGFMNGLDAAAVALGQDWRGIEAGAHAWAARDGAYRPLSTWRRVEGGLQGRCELPLAVGTVGGSTQAHDGVRAAFKLVGTASARDLSVVLASVGLASNLAALRALASEGIQRGHMRLHKRKHDPCEGAK